MANSEPREPRKELHLLLAFRRNKDNEDKKVLCRREVIRDESVDLERLKVKLRKIPGVWRIHRTVNARNVAKAANILQHRLLDNPADAESLESVWKTCLLQKESRGERNVLIDIDDPAKLVEVMARLIGEKVPLEKGAVSTPSGGYHLVVPSFDTRVLQWMSDVTIQRDGYVFLEQFNVEEEQS